MVSECYKYVKGHLNSKISEVQSPLKQGRGGEVFRKLNLQLLIGTKYRRFLLVGHIFEEGGRV